ncbi:zinc finger CCCH domain-containing protein 8-like isoform X2 [Tasmannia lanceolata]|uniref:zinc finger CCCH domain-containing protein 8-like isoform X2 n=1 Tax=Tasmannia lanceolata TaxID=3420 RepID=UPI004062CC04
MANHIYGYNPSYGGSNLSSSYSSRLNTGSIPDPYPPDFSLIGSSRYLSSDPLSTIDSSRFSDRGSMFMNQNDSFRFSGTDIGAGGTGNFTASRFSGGFGAAPAAAPPSFYPSATWPGVDVMQGSGIEPAVPGVKRPPEALFSTNSLAKRPRIESASNLPIYPQRPGEKDCAHYMLTRTCKFGDSCRFDHPLWVPEGGIPDWKEVPLIPVGESLPERPGEPDCPYFLKTQKCKFGFRCKFNHPKDNVEVLNASVEGASETVDISVLPERPSEPICSFYMKSGKCKFGANCKFHHPKDIQIPSAGEDPSAGGQNESAVKDGQMATGDANQVKTFVPFTPALLHNSKGLPIRPGEIDCPFYLKTGSCKYGATCRFNHPERTVINPPVAAVLGQAMISSPATSLPIGFMNPAASILPNIDPRLAQAPMGLGPTVGPTVYPQRPGQMECDHYMKTGECKFGERCKFHHPIDRSAPTPSMMKQAIPNVKLTLAGLPRREGAIVCPFYMKTGSCRYGATCRFDHPPPGEVMAMATVQTTSSAPGEEKAATEATQQQ